MSIAPYHIPDNSYRAVRHANSISNPSHNPENAFKGCFSEDVPRVLYCQAPPGDRGNDRWQSQI